MRECLTSLVGVESRFSGDSYHCIYINAVVGGGDEIGNVGFLAERIVIEQEEVKA